MVFAVGIFFVFIEGEVNDWDINAFLQINMGDNIYNKVLICIFAIEEV